MRVLFVTNIVCPNTVYLFNEIYKCAPDTSVLYTRKFSVGRNYDHFYAVTHPHRILKEFPIKNHLYFNYEVWTIFQRVRQADCIVIGQFSNPTYALCAVICKILGKKVIYWGEAVTKVAFEERPIFTSKLGLLLRQTVIRAYRSLIQEVWPIGEKCLLSLRKEGFKQPHKFFYYYSDLSVFFSARKVPVSPSKEFKFIVIGSLNHRKGFDLILEAAEMLTKQGFQFSFHIYGDGPLIEERSNFVYHGFKPHEEIVKELSHADAFLLPSRYDGWGVALIEALAAGVPVITSRNVGASEVIVEECDGIVLESLTAKHLAEAMALLIQKPRKSEQTGLCAQRLTAASGARDFLNNLHILTS